MTANALKIIQCAQNVVKAEYAFRAGKHAYSIGTQTMFEHSLEELREVLTGERELGRAANKLGITEKVNLRRKRFPLVGKQMGLFEG
jgi:hypothetical protein